MNLERQQLGEVVAPGVNASKHPRTASSLSLLTLDQVAEMFQVSKAWVRDHATRREPRIPVVRFGDRRAVLRFRAQDVEQFIAQHLVLEDGL
jgi:predicted DNA-binding transcriptional regulator AlpA